MNDNTLDSLSQENDLVPQMTVADLAKAISCTTGTERLA